MRRSLSLHLLLLLALVLSGCVVQPPAVSIDGEPAGEQTYVLGIVQPFTGSLDSFGTDFGRGIELAVKEMNAELAAAGPFSSPPSARIQRAHRKVRPAPCRPWFRPAARM